MAQTFKNSLPTFDICAIKVAIAIQKRIKSFTFIANKYLMQELY